MQARSRGANVWSTKCWKGKGNNATDRLTYLSVEQSWQKWSPHVSHWRTHPWHTVRSQNWQWWLPAVWRHVSHTVNIYTVLTFTANIHAVPTFTANIHILPTFTEHTHSTNFYCQHTLIPTFTANIHTLQKFLICVSFFYAFIFEWNKSRPARYTRTIYSQTGKNTVSWNFYLVFITDFFKLYTGIIWLQTDTDFIAKGQRLVWGQMG